MGTDAELVGPFDSDNAPVLTKLDLWWRDGDVCELTNENQPKIIQP